MRGLALGLVLLAACGGNGPGDDDGVVIPDAPGGGGSTTMVNWTLRQSGTATTCQAVGATEVWVDITPENGQPMTKVFQCVLPPGSIQLPAGRYAIEAKLYSSSSGTLATAPQQPVTVPTSATVQFIFYM